MPEDPVSQSLPTLPQSNRLRASVSDLSADPQVAALWLGGSFARGEADPYSDIDLRVALQAGAYEPERIPEGAASLTTAATTRLRFHFGGQATLWHMLLDDGTIYDLHVQLLTPVVQAIQQRTGDLVLALVGEPARTPEELMEAASHLRDETSRVGRLLAEKLGFDYPAAAEETVRRSWAQFSHTNGGKT
jgi:hypothetical protein